jgi:DNA-binding CsgD family transcriptional regulator
MVAAVSEQFDLLLPLIEGLRDAAQRERFLFGLVARTQARRGVMVIRLANAGARDARTVLQTAAQRALDDPPIDIDRLHDLGLPAYAALRPDRVYATEEMLNFDDSDALAQQRALIGAMGIRHARWMRVTVDQVGEVTILLTRQREDFTASAVVTLSGLAPYLRAALRGFSAASEERLQRVMAQRALTRLGIGQIALDDTARVMAADSEAERLLTFIAPPDGKPGRRLQLPPAAADGLERGCATFAARSSDAPSHILITVNDRLTLLLQPAYFAAAPGMPHPVAVATLRTEAREAERSGAAVLRDHFGLSPREAALAEKLSRGEMIVEAGRDLHLTAETARNYSKRIYARTGTRGQADLVRLILTGLAPLA